MFEFPNFSNQEIIIVQEKTGLTTGEYFGAAIGVGDINGDQLDDIIVGAPHYSKIMDEGRIYIFYGSKKVGFEIFSIYLHMFLFSKNYIDN